MFESSLARDCLRMLCLNCSKETTNPKFCSRSCAATINNKISPKRDKEHACKECSVPINGGRSYCALCHTAIRRRNWGKVTYASMSDHLPYQKHSTIRGLSRKWYLESVNNKVQCAVCGYDKHVDVCHIKAIGSFSKSATIAEINSLTNLIGLCKNHHWELDRGLLVL